MERFIKDSLYVDFTKLLGHFSGSRANRFLAVTTKGYKASKGLSSQFAALNSCEERALCWGTLQPWGVRLVLGVLEFNPCRARWGTSQAWGSQFRHSKDHLTQT